MEHLKVEGVAHLSGIEDIPEAIAPKDEGVFRAVQGDGHHVRCGAH